MRTVIFFVLTAVCTTMAVGDDSAEAIRRDTARVAQMLEKHADGGVTGESVAWQWNWFLGPILEQCRKNPTDDRLEPTEVILNTMLDKMAAGPDGYRGFIGPYIYNMDEYCCDVHVGDAILISHVLNFAMIIHDHPELREKYQKSADRFVATAKRDLIEKWNERETFVEDGPFGGFSEWNQFCKPGDLENWFEQNTPRPGGTPMPSLPFNKAMDMADCMLRIHYLTGEAEYKTQAEKIYNRVKAGMNPYQGGYTWNYWEPVSTRDVIVRENGRRDLTHWVGTHPYRDYQAGEVRKIVFAYDMGVTFTESDIRRLVHTNLKFMWNGDRDDPQWANSDSKLPGYQKAPPSEAYPTTAGTVWDDLARFDPTIRYLAEKKTGKEPTAQATQAVDADAFVRKFAPDADVKEFPWMKDVAESGGQIEAIAIPSVVPPGENTILISKANPPRSDAEVYVRPLEGGTMTRLVTFRQGDSVQMFYDWDGTIDGVRTPGEYVILWKYRDGERAYPVTLK